MGVSEAAAQRQQRSTPLLLLHGPAMPRPSSVVTCGGVSRQVLASGTVARVVTEGTMAEIKGASARSC